MDIIASIAWGAGAAWASGIKVYAVILALGVLGGTGCSTLPPDLQILTNPLIIAAAGFMHRGCGRIFNHLGRDPSSGCVAGRARGHYCADCVGLVKNLVGRRTLVR